MGGEHPAGSGLSLCGWDSDSLESPGQRGGACGRRAAGVTDAAVVAEATGAAAACQRRRLAPGGDRSSAGCGRLTIRCHGPTVTKAPPASTPKAAAPTRTARREDRLQAPAPPTTQEEAGGNGTGSARGATARPQPSTGAEPTPGARTRVGAGPRARTHRTGKRRLGGVRTALTGGWIPHDGLGEFRRYSPSPFWQPRANTSWS
jgi:hypothetical protein